MAGWGSNFSYGDSFYMDEAERCQRPRAFISNFQVVAQSITGTDLAQDFLQKTERRTVIISKMYSTIVASAMPDGTTVAGTISPSGSIQVLYGSNQSFTIAPNAGYQISSVIVDGSSVGSVTNYSFMNVMTGHDISAIFDRT